MEKSKLRIWKVIFGILTVLLICNTCDNLYAWLSGDNPIEYMGNIPMEVYYCFSLVLMIFWFTLYCVIVHLKTSDMNLPYEKYRRKWVIKLPIILLFMDILLNIMFFVLNLDGIWYGDEISTKIMCLLFAFVIIGILFYTGKQDNIMLWYPVSLYCTIYTNWLIGLDKIIVFSIIEYGIMLFLNRRKWYIPKDKRQNKD